MSCPGGSLELALLLCAIALLGGCALNILAAAEPAAEASSAAPIRFHAMLSDSLFAGLTGNDAKASISVLVDRFARRRHLRFDTRVEIFKSSLALSNRLKSNTLDLMVLSILDFFELEESGLIQPVAFAIPSGQGPGARYLLLTGRAGDQMAELRGANLVVASRSRCDLGLIWLETLLAERKLASASRLFGSVVTTYQASSCALPLFFGSIDACVLDESNWDVLKDLNPQLSRLQTVAASEPVVEAVVAMPATPHPYRKEFVESLLRLHQDPVGSQVILLFKTGRLVPADSRLLESTRRMVTRYQSLKGAQARPVYSSEGKGGTR